MIALCVDDEILLLHALKKAVSQSEDISGVAAFTDENEALEWAESNSFDIAFLDIELHGTNGLAAAEQLRKINPGCGIVFCTGYAEYALEAIEKHLVDGYLLKPVRAEKIQSEIDHIKARLDQRGSSAPENYLLSVDFKDGFSVFDSAGKLLVFKRKRAEELLAALIRNNGAVIDTSALCGMFWDDNTAFAAKNRNYLYKLIGELQNVLEKCGANGVIFRTNGGYAADMSRIRIL